MPQFDRFTELKICLTCGKEKHISEFYKNRSANDGYAHSCKKCSNITMRKYQKNWTGIRVPKVVKDELTEICNRKDVTLVHFMKEVIKKVNRDDGVIRDYSDFYKKAGQWERNKKKPPKDKGEE